MSPMCQAKNWQYQSVITQGLTLTNHNNFYGDSQGSPSLEFTEFTVSGSYQFHPSSRLSAQTLYRHAGAIEELSIDYLLLDSQLFSNAESLFGARLGRYKIPFGLYNETRDVAFARQSVLLPQSLYTDSQRDLKLAAEGGQLYSSFFSEYGQWDLDLYYGAISLDNISGFSEFPPEATFSNEAVAGLRLLFESFNGDWRAAISALEGKVDIFFNLQDLDAGIPLSADVDGEVKQAEVYFSLEYNWENWILSGEYRWNRRQTNFPVFTFPVPINPEDFAAGFVDFDLDLNIKQYGQAYYVQGKYIFNPRWNVYLRWDVVYEDKNDKDGDEVVGRPGYINFAKDLTLGVLWNINAHMLAGAELHKVKGTQWLSELDNPDPFDTDEDWLLWVMTFSYRL
ncbi:MAG: hypothetical protein HRU20_08690 [Pseudomonadales bacterium]|nr:hypothetical protein [Pseudomonadales bacterium]